jgi:hypothetical protein
MGKKDKKDKKATETKEEIVKVDATAILDEMGAEKGETAFTLDNGAEIAVSKFRLYFTNPADGIAADLEDTKLGDSEVLIRKSDGAIGIKFLKATPEEDVRALLDLAADSDIFVAPEPKPEDEKTEDAEAKAA